MAISPIAISGRAHASAAASAAALAAATSPAKHRQIVLHRLELGDRSAELHTIERVLDRLLEDLFERPGDLLQADRGSKADEQILIHGCRTHGLRDGAFE